MVRRLPGAYRFLVGGFLLAAFSSAPLRAERQIVDLHRLDANFQLFAADSSVPWKPSTVRLDTYSSAPVAFSVYQVDPVDVLTAGSNFSPRAISTARRRALLSFSFTPPGGYQFQSNVVTLPLGAREGFFVVEARRGNVGEQVWINRSRLGLVAKATPAGLALYGTDVRTGLPLSHMRLALVVNRSFVSAMTDGDGLVRWSRPVRPVFALAQWGASYAFLNPLPQAPVPSTIIGVRTDSAVVHAGDVMHVAGFARTRSRGVLRASTGSASVTLRNGAATIAEHRMPLDAAGAFATSFEIPPNAAAGEYAVLAQAGGGVGGATVDVDANSGSLSLDVSAACGGGCNSDQDVPVLVHASHGGTTVHVIVVRAPHVYFGEGPQGAPIDAAAWLDVTVSTDANGNATVAIPHPSDGLSSTYGVRVESGGATADTRITVPTSQAVLRLTVDHAQQSLGMPLGFDVDAVTLDGKPLAGSTVTITLTHGPSGAQQQLRLDVNGHARGSFSAPPLGTNFLLASLDHGGRAMDAAQVRIDPQAAVPSTDGASPNVRITLDRQSYRPDEDLTVNAEDPGSQGDAFITYESALGVQTRVVRTSGGRATAHVRAVDAEGELRVGVAFVRDGAIEWNTMPVVLTAGGRPRVARLAMKGDLAAAQSATLVFDGPALGPGTFVVRISRGAPSGSALFSSAPALLTVGVTTTQNSASESATWHPGVNSSGERAQALGFVRRSQPPPELSLAQAQTQAVSWDVARSNGGAVSIALPPRAGRYELSVLGIADDGSVTAAASTISVR